MLQQASSFAPCYTARMLTWAHLMGKGQSTKLQWRQCLLAGLPGAWGLAGRQSLPPQMTAAAAPRQRAGQGRSRAVGGPHFRRNHGVKLVRSVQYPALPSCPQPEFGGKLTGEIWHSVNKGGRFCFFSSSGSYSISGLQWAGYFCNS